MNIKHYIIACLSLLVLASCGEKDDAIVEYADWKNKNDQYFEKAFLAHEYDEALLKYSLSDETDTQYADYVLVEKLSSEPFAPSSSPYLNDTVLVHYVGHLIPSPSYDKGFQFDQSLPGAFRTRYRRSYSVRSCPSRVRIHDSPHAHAQGRPLAGDGTLPVRLWDIRLR